MVGGLEIVVDEGEIEGGLQIVETMDLRTVTITTDAVDWNWSKRWMGYTLHLCGRVVLVPIPWPLDGIAWVFRTKGDLG